MRIAALSIVVLLMSAGCGFVEYRTIMVPVSAQQGWAPAGNYPSPYPQVRPIAPEYLPQAPPPVVYQQPVVVIQPQPVIVAPVYPVYGYPPVGIWFGAGGHRGRR